MSQQNVQQQVAAQIARAFPFKILKLPLSGPDNLPTPHFGLFRDDMTDVKGCLSVAVKEAYQPHTLDDIQALAESAIIGFDSQHDAQVRCRWNGRGEQVIIEPSKDYRRSVYGTKDYIYPRALIYARYGQAFSATCGLFRDACSNLEMIQQVEGCTIKIRHASSLREKMDELIDDFRTLAAKFENVYEMAKHLEDRTHSVADFLSTLYPVSEIDSERKVARAKAKAETMITRLFRERDRVGRPDNQHETATLWELVNIVTGYVQHNKSRHGEPSGTDRALISIEDDETHNAWELALSLCE